MGVLVGTASFMLEVLMSLFPFRVDLPASVRSLEAARTGPSRRATKDLARRVRRRGLAAENTQYVQTRPSVSIIRKTTFQCLNEEAKMNCTPRAHGRRVLMKPELWNEVVQQQGLACGSLHTSLCLSRNRWVFIEIISEMTTVPCLSAMTQTNNTSRGR